MSERDGLRPKMADFRLDRTDFRPKRLDLGSEWADLRSTRAILRLERADLMPEAANFRLESRYLRPDLRQDLRPERPEWSNRGGETNELTNLSPPVFFVPFGAAAQKERSSSKGYRMLKFVANDEKMLQPML